MRVLILSDSYLPAATGTALRVSQLVRSIPNPEGIHIATLASDFAPEDGSPASVARYERMDGVHVHRFPSERSLLAGLPALHRRYSYDLVHARGVRMGLYARVVSILSRIPYLIELNSVNPQRNPMKARLWEHVLRSARRLIVLTRYAGEWLSAEYGIPAGKIDVVMNGVDLDRFSISDAAPVRETLGLGEDPVVGYAGTFWEWQGVFDFVHAASLVAHECPETRFLMVGDGPVFDETQALAADYGMEDRFVFTGLVAPEEVPGYVQAMDVFLIPRPPRFLKNQIATPLKLLEAMALERAVVVSPVHGLRDLVDDGRTALVSAPNAESYAGAVLKLIRDPGLRAEIGAAARETVASHYTWNAAARHLHQAYVAALK